MNFAIIDATAGNPARAPEGPSGCRYATPIANLPLICHVCDELARSGITRAEIIAQPPVLAELARIVGGSRVSGLDLKYVEAPDHTRLAVLSKIEQALLLEPVLLHPGDSLFRSQVGAMRDRFSAGDVDSVLPEQAPVTSPRELSARQVSGAPLVLGLGTRDIVTDLLSPSRNGEDLIESLLASDCRLAVCPQTEHWCYSETTEGLLAANRMMLDAITVARSIDAFAHNNQMHGRIAISPSACVSNCVLHGPVSIDDGAMVEDSFLGPYTAVGPGVIVSGAELDNTMVLEGAELRHPGFRIEGSIIGERSHVTRSFALPTGLHLRLGADSRVTFS